MQKIDLHLHSNNSDGSLAVSEVVKNLVRKKITFAVLADHDSVDGSNEFAKLALRAGIKTADGVEMSVYENGVGVHILGYGIDVGDKRVLKFFKAQKDERKNVFEKYITLFKKAGFKIDKKLYNEFAKAKSVTKTHIFKLMWKLPENRNICFQKGLKENKAVPPPFNFQSPFINMFMTFPGQLAYVRKKQVSAEEAIKLIHRIGGAAVWAHPGLEIEFRKSPKVFPKVFKNLLSYGLDGLEVYPTASSHTKEWMAYLHNLAKKHKLLATLGTDDHDGDRTGRLKIPEKYQDEIIRDLISRLAKIKHR